jgi:hypothetical protein
MITITNNYFQDLKTAIAASVLPANAKPKKAALYEAIAEHNEQLGVPVDSELDALKSALQSAKDAYFEVQRNWDSDMFSKSKEARLEKEIASLETAIAAHGQPSVAELEAQGKEEDVQTALLAMDAVEDAQPKPKKEKAPSKLDLLAQAIADGVEDIDQLAAISGMKPQGVKGWVGVIRNRGVENWKQACKKQSA